MKDREERRLRRPLLFCSFCLVIIIAVVRWANPVSTETGPPETSRVILTGKVCQKDSKSFLIKIHATGLWQQNSQTKILCKYDDAEQLILGSEVRVEGDLSAFEPATNPGEFDYAAYYGSLGYAGKLEKVSVLGTDRYSPGLQEKLYRLQRYFERRLYRIFPEKEASVMTAILLGDKTGLDADLKALYRRNGIIHILSISGLHITLLGMGLYRLLRRGGVPVWAAALGGSILLVLYGIMTGFGVSACRAIGMYLLRMLAQVWGRTYDMLTALGVMAAGMVCVNPAYLGHMGFLLSFSAVLGAGALLPVLQELWEKGREMLLQYAFPGGFAERKKTLLRYAPLREFTGEKEPLSGCALPKVYEEKAWKRHVTVCMEKLKHGIQQGLLASLSITLTTMPIQLWFNYEMPVYSMFLNLLILPFMSILMVTGLVAMLIPGLGFVGTLDVLILMGYEALCQFFQSLPHSIWNPGRPEIWKVVLYYVVWIWMVWGAGLIKKECRGVRFLLLVMAICIMLFPHSRSNLVTFLDVGQGDGICVQLSSGEVYLFDCGSSSRSKIGSRVLIPYLKYYGISEIDGVFISHADTDHMNGILELLALSEEEHIKIRQLVLPAISDQTRDKEFEKILCAVENMKHPVPVTTICEGVAWQSGGKSGTSFLCLHPESVGATEPGENPETARTGVAEMGTAEMGTAGMRTAEMGTGADTRAGTGTGADTGNGTGIGGNAASECFYIVFEQFGEKVSLLLTGDVEGAGEMQLLQCLKERGVTSVDFLKCAHHGSAGTTSTAFLKQIKPRCAIISCGRNNRYGHPHEETLARFEDAGVKVLRTDELGAIEMYLKEGRTEIVGYGRRY